MIVAIIWKSESDCQSGFSIGGKLISNLTYADDIALVNTAQKDQKFIDCLVKYSAEVGLCVNVSKTECMSTDQNNNLRLTINGKIIKQVKTFIYLGHKLSSDNNGLVLDGLHSKRIR